MQILPIALQSRILPQVCDSPSSATWHSILKAQLATAGVGSASNSGIGMVVGYVGASHVADDVRNSHAEMLMEGAKADSGIGADIVIEDFTDLTHLVRIRPVSCSAL